MKIAKNASLDQAESTKSQTHTLGIRVFVSTEHSHFVKANEYRYTQNFLANDRIKQINT
jgi:hypothetical protein